MQELLAEKDAELRQLAGRIERMEARRGAMDELQQLDALEARLKVGNLCRVLLLFKGARNGARAACLLSGRHIFRLMWTPWLAALPCPLPCLNALAHPDNARCLEPWGAR